MLFSKVKLPTNGLDIPIVNVSPAACVFIPFVAVPTMLRLLATGTHVEPSSAVTIVKTDPPTSKSMTFGLFEIAMVPADDVRFAACGVPKLDPIAIWPSARAFVQPRAFVSPWPYGIDLSVCDPNFALRLVGTIVLVESVPAMASGSVASSDIPFWISEALKAVMVRVSPPAIVWIPCGASPKTLRLFPTGEAVPTSAVTSVKIFPAITVRSNSPVIAFR